METLGKITARIRGDADGIMESWRRERVGLGETETFEPLSGRMEALISVFAEFLESPEGVDSFTRGGGIRALVARIADDQHALDRDAVGVIEDYSVLRRCVWRSVEGGVDLSDAPGADVAGFFAKLMQASDWVTEAGLQAFDTTTRREMERALGRAEATDLVTGLPDREQFNRLLLPGAVRRGGVFSVLIFDVAHSTESVAEGNSGQMRDILRRLSEAVREVAPEDAERARFGDDEICVILPGQNSEEAYKTAERVLVRLADESNGFEVDVGLAQYPSHGSDAEELMAESLKALAMAKRVGGSGIVAAR